MHQINVMPVRQLNIAPKEPELHQALVQQVSPVALLAEAEFVQLVHQVIIKMLQINAAHVHPL